MRTAGEIRRRPWIPRSTDGTQSFIKTGNRAYSLTFRWGGSAHICWPNTAHEVQRRQYVDKWFGVNPPRDGDELAFGTIFDPDTMTQVGNYVWTHWEDAASLGSSARQYTHAFTGVKNYQVRVRAQNKYGSGEWTRPWLFTISVPIVSERSIWLQYP